MLIVECSGTPFDIGFQHGKEAKAQIDRCISFYRSLFQKTSKLDWPQVQELARGFEQAIKSKWPDYYVEMTGIAQGSGVSILDILALNVRTEIAFGKFSDGCTALAWNTRKHAFLAQNWDWNQEQKQNLIILKITSLSSTTTPAITMVTEAGIIGKIGLNSSGVGVCLNAIRAEGMDPTRLPVHLGLRAALESTSAGEAAAKLKRYGIAASAHILVADADEAFGCESTALTSAFLRPDDQGRIIHTNHLLLDHGSEVVDTAWLKDSPFRVQRMRELSSDNTCAAGIPDEIGTRSENGNENDNDSSPTWEDVSGFFKDRENAPAAICRSGKEIETLFGIVMDLKQRRAVVTVGRPDTPEDVIELGFS